MNLLPIWAWIGLICAFSVATADAFSKHFLQDKEPLTVALIRWFYTSLFLSPALFMEPIRWSSALIGWLVLVMPLEVFAISIYMKALKTSPLSLVAPFTSLSPVFLFFISYFLLGEVPHLLGVVGVFLVVAGSFYLNSGDSTGKGRAPWDVYRDPGVRCMLLATLTFAFTAPISKKIFLLSPTVSLIALYSLLSSLTLILYLFFRQGFKPFRALADRPYRYWPMALFDAVGYWSNFAGMRQTDVSYFIAIKRTSLFFAILYGGILFKEKDLRGRLFGGVLMLLGILLIALFRN